MQHLKQPFIIKTFDVGPMQNLVYVISDTKTNFAAIVDPAWDLKEVYSYINENNLELKNILLTHSHNDHVNAIDEILLKFDLSIYLNHKEKIFWNKSYDNFKINYGGDIINLGSTDLATNISVFYDG